MRVLIPARHGLGDVLSGYFIAQRGRRILARVRDGFERGWIVSAMLAYEAEYSPNVGDVFRALPFKLLVKKTTELPEVDDADGDNRMPDAVRWHQNVYTNPPSGFEQLDGSRLVECPTRRPVVGLPNEFLLLSDAAGAPDRLLTDPTIYEFLREVVGLPIVKIGHGHDAVPADVNLSNRLNIVESLYIGSRARLVVAGLTMMRTFSGLFGVPVIELAERPSPETVRRTRREYDEGQYGMRASLNKWFLWPADRDRISDALRSFRRMRRG